MILGIARLVLIDLEPRRTSQNPRRRPHREPGTQCGIVQRYLFSSMRAELAQPAAESADQAEDVVDVLHQAETLLKAPRFPRLT